MRPFYLATTILLLIVTTTSCKKENVPDPFDLSPGSMSMKVDGAPRESEIAFVLTIPEETSGRYVVSITGFFAHPGTTSDDEVTDSFHIYMNLTAAQFRNPKGTYDMIAIENENDGQPVMYALYQVGTGTENAHQVYGMVDNENTKGKVTITDFEISDNITTIPGFPSTTGYTKLQGTFDMKLMGATVAEHGTSVNITDGKFSVRSQIGW